MPSSFIHPLLVAQIPRSNGPSFGGAGRTWGKGFVSLNGEGRLFRVPLAKPDGTLGLPFGSFAFRWRSQGERSICLSGLSRSAGEARGSARFAFRVFRVPLAKPDGTLGLPFGSLRAPRAEPAEPHPTLGAFFTSGSNAPNPLAVDCPVMPDMRIHRDLHCHFAFHSGIGGWGVGWGARPALCYTPAVEARAAEAQGEGLRDVEGA